MTTPSKGSGVYPWVAKGSQVSQKYKIMFISTLCVSSFPFNSQEAECISLERRHLSEQNSAPLSLYVQPIYLMLSGQKVYDIVAACSIEGKGSQRAFGLDKLSELNCEWSWHTKEKCQWKAAWIWLHTNHIKPNAINRNKL
jgi:hypothetical protein